MLAYFCIQALFRLYSGSFKALFPYYYIYYYIYIGNIAGALTAVDADVLLYSSSIQALFRLF
jgi:hypothetical protein